MQISLKKSWAPVSKVDHLSLKWSLQYFIFLYRLEHHKKSPALIPVLILVAPRAFTVWMKLNTSCSKSSPASSTLSSCAKEQRCVFNTRNYGRETNFKPWFLQSKDRVLKWFLRWKRAVVLTKQKRSIHFSSLLAPHPYLSMFPVMLCHPSKNK